MKLLEPQKVMRLYGTDFKVPMDVIGLSLEASDAGVRVMAVPEPGGPECVVALPAGVGVFRQRAVEYHELLLVVPHNTKWLSADANGVVSAHSGEPWHKQGYYEGHEIGYVAKVDLEGMPWEDSLVLLVADSL